MPLAAEVASLLNQTICKSRIKPMNYCLTNVIAVRAPISPLISDEACHFLQVDDDKILLETFAGRWVQDKLFVVVGSVAPDLLHVQLVFDLLKSVGLPYVEVWNDFSHAADLNLPTTLCG